MGSWEADWNRDVLERIAALLFALAGLADFAANASYRRRRQVLGILSHGEAEARAFVIALATGAAMPGDEPADVPETPGDAARLAASFRALALALCALLARRSALPLTAAYPRTDWRKSARPACRQAPLFAPDTS